MHYYPDTRRGMEEVGFYRIYSCRWRSSHVEYLPTSLSCRVVPDVIHSVYVVRLGLTTYYEYRTSTIQSHLTGLQRQRDSTIEKLKAATKYNDTQDLLKKYSGTPTPKTKPETPSERKASQKQGDGRDGPGDWRITSVPPPTANIPGRNGTPTSTNTPQRSALQTRSPLGQDAHRASGATPPTQRAVSSQSVSAEFAPNAFPAAPQYSQVNEGSRWYDRITDALLGEDETLPRTRLALICENCRLVNGQAPPGVKRLEDVGKWRCGGCGAVKYVNFLTRAVFTSGPCGSKARIPSCLSRSFTLDLGTTPRFAWIRDADTQTSFSGEESEAKKVVASIKKQAYSEAKHSGKDEEGGLERKNHDMNPADAATSSEDGHESEITQYSSESSNSTQGMLPKGTKVAEPENIRRRSARSKRSGKKTS